MLGFIKNIFRRHDGNVAIMFALALFPIIILLGGAMDFDRRQGYDQKLQYAVDAATLAAVGHSIDNPDATDEEIETFAVNFIEKNYDAGGSALNPPKVIFDSEAGTMSVDATANVPTTLLGITGIKDLEANAYAETILGAGGITMEAVLVLDVSYSMVGDRIDALQKASKNFADIVMTDNSNVKVGVVPFSQYVNVGEDTRGSWLNVPASETKNSESCWISNNTYKKAGCTKEKYNCSKDGKNRKCTRWKCPSNVDTKKLKRTCKKTTSSKSFKGCVRSRLGDLDVQDSGYTTTKIEGISATNACVAPLLPLTDKLDTVKKHIDDLWVSNDTYIAPGISWGTRILSDGEPFTEGEPIADFLKDGGQKVLIVMSDGQNTRSRNNNNGYHNWHEQDQADAKTKLACEEATALGIQVYTIALDVSDTTTLDLLKGCATKIDYFHSVTFASELTETFESVASSLKEARLTR